MTDYVWVTGISGFIGKHLKPQLLRSGLKVIGFVRQSKANATALPLSHKGFLSAVNDYGSPRKIFHIAGGATVSASFKDPWADFTSNVSTTACLMDCVRKYCPSSPVVFASSAAVYGPGHNSPISNKAHLCPFSPYGEHKRMAELLIKTYTERFQLKTTLLRLFSVYGPKMEKQLLYEICTQLAQTNTTVSLFGTGNELRDFCHITDAVRALTTLDAPNPGTVNAYNVGTGDAISINEVASQLCRLWKTDRKIVFSGENRLGDPFSLVAGKDSMPPGFETRVPFSKGLEDFVKHYKLDN